MILIKFCFSFYFMFLYRLHGPFILVKDLKEKVLLGVPFLSSIFPMWVDYQGIRTKLLDKEILFEFANPPGERSINTIKDQVIKAKQNHINLLKQEIALVRIEDQLKIKKTQDAIESLKNKIIKEVCSNIPNAFWHRKQHEVELPYEPDFSEKNIPTKARPIQMNKDLLGYCEKEIQDLIDKKLIRKSKSPWSCSAFYVQKQAELERGTPRLVINYKPLNDVLRWIRYPIPNKKDLLQRLGKSKVFSKFDMKSGFWQIQIAEKDRYKTTFVVPFGHYEWNVMPFGLKNAPSEFQNIMNEIFNQFSDFIIVYIDDVLIYSDSVEQHWKHLNKFIETVKSNGLSLSATKINLFQTKIRFLGHHIHQGTFTPIQRSIEFADKFPDEIKDKKQLQRFLGSLNYVSDFIQDLSQLCAPLRQRLKKNPIPWNEDHTKIVKIVKSRVKTLPCLALADHKVFKIVETDASDIGFGGILKQRSNNQELLVRFTSGTWNHAQLTYSTIDYYQKVLFCRPNYNGFKHL